MRRRHIRTEVWRRLESERSLPYGCNRWRLSGGGRPYCLPPGRPPERYRSCLGGVRGSPVAWQRCSNGAACPVRPIRRRETLYGSISPFWQNSTALRLRGGQMREAVLLLTEVRRTQKGLTREFPAVRACPVSICTQESVLRRTTGFGSRDSCRYTARPPVAVERLSLLPDGKTPVQAQAPVAQRNHARGIRAAGVCGEACGAGPAAEVQYGQISRDPRPGVSLETIRGAIITGT